MSYRAMPSEDFENSKSSAFVVFKSWVIRLLKTGTNDHFGDTSLRIVFSNSVFIALPVAYGLIALLHLILNPFQIPDSPPKAIIQIILVCFLCLTLNSLGRSTLSRILFLVLWPILMVMQSAPDQLSFSFPIDLIFHSAFIQIMFSVKKETLICCLLMLFNFSVLLAMDDVLAIIRFANGIQLPSINYNFAEIRYWLLFNVITFLILQVVESFIKSSRDARRVIEVQKEELNRLNLDLEEIVSQRTSELAERNEKLHQYAFYNAHHLRGPFCTVQGLVEVLNLTADPNERAEVEQKIVSSLAELDSMINQIQGLTTLDD